MGGASRYTVYEEDVEWEKAAAKRPHCPKGTDVVAVNPGDMTPLTDTRTHTHSHTQRMRRGTES